MDVAALSLRIDSSEVVRATKDLERFSTASDRAKASAGASSSNTAKMAQDYARVADRASQFSGAAARAAAANDNAAAAARRATAANENLSRSFGQADAHVEAFRKHLASIPAAAQAASTGVDKVNRSVAASAGALKANTGNIAAQFQDIGVTAAMGMNPLIIGLQQGTQLSAVFAQSGASMGAVLAGAFRQIASAQALMTIGLVAAVAGLIQMVDWVKLAQAALNVLADNLVAIAPYAVGAAAALALIYSPAIISGLLTTISTVGKLALSMLALIPIPVLIVAGLTAIVAAAVAFRDDLTKMLGFDIVQVVHDSVNWIVGAFVGGFNGIKASWGKLPAALGDIAYQSANAMLAGIDFLINRSIDGINDLISRANQIPLVNIKTIGKVSVGRVDNPYAGAAAGVASSIQSSVKAAQGVDYVGKAIAGVNSLAAAGAGKLREWASALGAATDKKKTKGADAAAGGKTDAERLADIIRNAEAEITAERNREKAVSMSARAAAELEQRTKLLNQAAKAGIPLTDGLRSEVDRLAKGFADAKIAADTAKAIDDFNKSVTDQRRAIGDEVALIGLYGDALTRARIEQEALNRARASLPKGETLSAGAEAGVRAGAASVADDRIAADRAARAEKLRKDAEDAAHAMDRERGAIGLTGAAALQYAFVTDKLVAAKRDGIALSPAEVAAIEAAGSAYAQQRQSLDDYARKMSDTREVARGFLSDLTSGLRNGANAFTALADSAMSALNRIIDKLLDRTLDSFLDGMFKTGSAGGTGSQFGRSNQIRDILTPNALGGVYGAPERFAKGGAFTNSIVTSPTLFRFAKGSALGEMGEAGPEAIMPLKRGPNGSLGVQMHGGGRPTVQMGDVHLHQSFAGAVGIDSIRAMNEQSAREAVSYVRRNFADIAAEYEQNGVVSA